MRGKKVVGVEEHEQLAVRERDASVACCRDAASFQVVDGDPSGKKGKQLRGAVRRSVVDDDQLRGYVLLRKHTLDRIGDVRLSVPHGDDDGDRGDLGWHARMVRGWSGRAGGGATPRW